MPLTTSSLDLNPLFVTALHKMEHTSSDLFITGQAGTGKSRLLRYFRERTNKKLVVLAPTGIAAVNVNGQTIHSFFRFKTGITIATIKEHAVSKNQKKLYQQLSMIIIDEISMVRADLLDCIDYVLRSSRERLTEPFGGVQVIFIGDLYQLPPVVNQEEQHIFNSYYATPYFFSAKVFVDFNLEIIELTKVYRQKDPTYIELLNAVRNNTITPEEIHKINQRYLPDFKPNDNDFYIYLAATNAQVAAINDTKLNKITNKSHKFYAKISGEFGKEYYPTAALLEIKIGAQVMMINNDDKQDWVNGDIGKIVNVIKDQKTALELIVVKLDSGSRTCYVGPYNWSITRLVLEAGQLNSVVIGNFTQYPLMLAWAVTIHKSQGKTFNKVIIDLSKTFAHGQSYVALSRCTSLKGIVLKKPLLKKHIWFDPLIVDFLNISLLKQDDLTYDKVKVIQKAISLQKNLQLTYKKTDEEIFKLIIKPFKT
jgi:ATP-dependent DNA helicase PIF1